MWYGLVNYSQYEARRHWAHSKSVLKSHVRSYQSTSFFFFFCFIWISSSYILLCGHPCLLHGFPYLLLNVLKVFSNYKVWFFSWGQLVYSETMFICINWSRKWRIFKSNAFDICLQQISLWIWMIMVPIMGLPCGSAGKEFACNAGDAGSIPRLGRSSGEGIGYPLQYSWASLVAQIVKNLLAMWETWVQSLGWEDPLEEGMATHSGILAWRIPMDEGAWEIVSLGISFKSTPQ